MLVLNKKDIEESITILNMLEAVEKAFVLYQSGDFTMPDRMHIHSGENVLLLMPAMAGKFFSTKLASVYPGNVKADEPSIYATVLLNNADSGKPLALLDGSIITSLRTGAIGGLAAAYTTPKDISAMGLLGAGVQGYYQVLFACTVRNLTTVNIFDPYNDKLADFIRKLEKYLPHVKFNISASAEALITNSELIITTTTSPTPVIPDDPELLAGKHYIGFGSFTPNMREFPDSLFGLLDHVIVDTDHAREESGDVCIPLKDGRIRENQILRLSELITGDKKIDVSRTTFVKSVGMALFDLLSAEMMYEKALENGAGTAIDF